MMPFVLSLLVPRIRTPWMIMLLTFCATSTPLLRVPPVNVIPGDGALKPSTSVFDGILKRPADRSCYVEHHVIA